ncbi:hypothetical protein OS175_10030, partial [Marinicella sp. S1101]|uniref:hypothetical protein n=1 Tax=Marinicella marina TaxID=2996016 RepID=UPI002260A07B
SIPNLNQELEIKFNPADDLSMTVQQEGAYVLFIKCNGNVTSYPTFEKAVEFTYILDTPPIVTAFKYMLFISFVYLISCLLLFLLIKYSPITVLKIHNKVTAFKNAPDIGETLIDKFLFRMKLVVNLLTFKIIPMSARSKSVMMAVFESLHLHWEKNDFNVIKTVQNSSDYVPLPYSYVSNGKQNLVKVPNSSNFRDLFELSGRYIEILGEGGAGKTMLAVEMARQMLNPDAKPHPRIPVFFEENFTSEISTKIVDQISHRLHKALNLDSNTPLKISNSFVELMLNEGYLVPIFDRISERNPETFDAVSKHLLTKDLYIKHIVVTTRVSMTSVGQLISIRPKMFELPETLTLFVTNLINKKMLVSVSDSIVHELCKNISLLTGKHSKQVLITPLLVKLYVDQAIQFIEKGRSFSEMPKTFLSIIESYIDFVSKEMHKAENNAVLRKLADLSLGSDMVPRDFIYDQALEMNDVDEEQVKRLINNGLLKVKNDEIRGIKYLNFMNDSYAEYLGASNYIKDILIKNPSESESVMAAILRDSSKNNDFWMIVKNMILNKESLH